jgi:hypothetical protein
MAPILDRDGQLTGICASNVTDTNSTPYRCYTLGGVPVAQPWPTQSGISSLHALDGVLRLEKKIYFAMTSSPTLGPRTARYVCWDFATSGYCSGFTSASSGRPVSPYTLRQDPYLPTCIWEVGDGGIFELFHRDTGELGKC